MAFALLPAIGLAGSALPASAADPAPGNFSSSFETSDPQPATNTVETGLDGKPIQGNLSGSSPTGLPGSLLGQVSAVTASAENAPNEVAVNLKDGNASTKWLVFSSAG